MGKVDQLRWSRIIPVAFIMYMLAYMDRINTAMVLPYMGSSFHFTSADIGFASGIFFVGYMVLQIPGGVLATRWSAKKTVLILMFLWGFSAISIAFVQTKTQFFIARVLLGIFEGGVWPATLVLLASWFPQKERARANALWILCLPISAVIMSPLTGWLLSFLSWRIVFVIEGMPPLIWSFVWYFTVADNPDHAKWASEAEKKYVKESIAAENVGKPENIGYFKACTNKIVILLIFAYFFWISGFYGYTMWVPDVIKGFNGISPSLVGLLSAIPFLFAGIAMVINSVHSDRTQEREAHIAIPLIVGAFGLIGGQYLAHTPVMKMIFLIITAIGVYAPYGPYWAMPTMVLRPEVAGAAIGIINALGNLGGFLGPYLVGYIKNVSSGYMGFVVLAFFLVVTSLLCILIKKANNDLNKKTDKSVSEV